MEQYKGKMREFILKLWMNPNIQQVPLAKKENHILNFVKENKKSLMQAFASETFFPKLNFDDAVRLLISELVQSILEIIQPIIDATLEKAEDPELRDKFTKEGGLSINGPAFRDFILQAMQTKKIRDQYLNVLTIIDGKFYNRYTPKALTYRKLIYIELTRRDKLTLAPEVIGDYMNLASLFRPLAFYVDTESGQQANDILCRQRKGSKGYAQISSQINSMLNDKVGFIPESLFMTGVDSSLNVNDNPDILGAPRLISIFSTRAQEYVNDLKVDRGAETPDKSWFNINRRSAKHSGMDVRFLEELYMVAGEEGW